MTSSPPPRWFILASLANFLHCVAFQCFFHLPAFLEEGGAGEFRIGVLMGLLPAAAIAVRPMVGRAIDRRGRRQVLWMGALGHAVACALYLPLGGSAWGVVLCRLMHGAAQGAVFTALITIAADLAPERRRAQAIGFFGAAGMVALFASGWIGDALLAHGRYDGLFLVAAGCAALGGLAMLPVPETRVPSEHSAAPVSFWHVTVHPRLRALWWIGTVYAVGLAACTTFVKTATLERGVGSLTLFFGGFGVAAGLLRLGFGWVPDVVGPRRCLVPSLACTATGLVALAWAHEGWHVAAAGVLCGTGHGYVFPCLSALIIQRASREARGVAMSLFTALFDVGALAGAPLLGLVAEGAGYTTMFLVAAAWVLVAGVSFLAFDRPQAAPSRPET